MNNTQDSHLTTQETGQRSQFSPVVRAPAGVLGIHDVEGVDMAGILGGVLSTAVHHLPMDENYTT